MAIYIDPPLWPAHGTLWSHLVSDTSYDELHAFAARVPLPRRGFDFDHYDVPASLFDHVVTLGAIPVGSRDVVHRLRDSGLRVRHFERAAQRPIRRRQFLVAEWDQLASRVGLDAAHTPQWGRLGAELIARWNETHRSYHDERHLEDVLLALDHLAIKGERVNAETLLAAWFHDAVYRGEPGEDERASSHLAVMTLAEFGLHPALVQQVGELIVATTPAFALPEQPPRSLVHLLDADLSIFASNETRYSEYMTAVRDEYAHVPLEEFRTGRAGILNTYLELPTIYRSEHGRDLWEARARFNLEQEIILLTTRP